MKSLSTLLIILICALGASAVTVTVSQPATTVATVGTSTTLQAAASSSHPITAWHIYVDSKNVFGGPMPTSTISANLTLAEGTHRVTVRAWDSTGAYDSQDLSLTATATVPPTPSDAGPTPPANAIKVGSDIQDLTGWHSCDDPSCSGSSSTATGSWWMSNHNTTPSLSGSSAQFHLTGTTSEDVLWSHPLGRDDSATRYLYDYWVYMPAHVMDRTYAFEHDVVWTVGGRKYDFSTQCHITSATNKTAHWDTWDGATIHWVHTNIDCSRLLQTSTWHHVKVLAERTPDLRTHYISFTLDGVTVPVQDTYTYRATKTSGWAPHFSVQIQVDLMSGSIPVSEYYDKANLFAW